MEAITIKINQEVIEKVIVKAVSDCVSAIDVNQRENLKCVNSDTAREILGIGKRAFDNLIVSKIIEPIQLGDGYKFPIWTLEEFQKDYRGMDLTSLENCFEAKKKVASRH